MTERDRCPLTESECNLDICKPTCYGLHTAKGLQKFSLGGNQQYMARGFNIAYMSFPESVQKAIDEFLSTTEQKRLVVYEEFLNPTGE